MVAVGDEVRGFRLDAIRSRTSGVTTFSASQPGSGLNVIVQTVDAAATPGVAPPTLRYTELEHPGLAPLLDSGQVDGQLFRILGQLAPRTLREELPDGGAADVLALLRVAAEGLDALHAADLIHGDIRPDTILIGASGAQLAPPALAVLTAGDDTAQALDPLALVYAAPEVLRGSAPGAASDRWSFAATILEVLVGVPPFESVDEAFEHARRLAAPTALEHVADELGEASPVLRRGLDPDPERRPQRAVDLVDALRTGTVPGTIEPPRRLLKPIVGIGAIVVAAVAVALVLTLSGEPRLEVPTLPEAAVAFGSMLDVAVADIETLDCNGDAPGASTPECTIMQSALPGANLIATEDGSIRSWTIAGASGTFRLQVLRPRDGGHFQVFLGDTHDVPDTGVHQFPENLTILENDVVSLFVVEGAVGVARTAGAETHRWQPARQGGPPSAADLLPGSGFDHELLVRVEYLPGVPRDDPEQYDAAAAIDQPSGEILETADVQISTELLVRVDLVLHDERLWLDLSVDDRRTSRVEVPGVEPDGELAFFDAFAYGDDQFGGAGLGWRNPEEPHDVERFFQIEGRTWYFIS